MKNEIRQNPIRAPAKKIFSFPLLPGVPPEGEGRKVSFFYLL